MIKVSICCITYNHAPFIRKCLDGFLMQQCDFEYEILIHDDASTDGTIEIIREYELKYPAVIKPIIQTENQYSQGVRGINFIYNFPRARGEYIAMCEGDDFWIDPHKLSKQVLFMERNSDCSLCFTGCEIRKSSGENKKVIYKKATLIDADHYLCSSFFMATASLLFKKSILKTPNEPWMKKSFAGDFILRYKALLVGKIGFLPDICVVYNKGQDGSWSSRKLTKEIIQKEYTDNIEGLKYLARNISVDKKSLEYKNRKLLESKLLKIAILKGGMKGLFVLIWNMNRIGLRTLGFYAKNQVNLNNLSLNRKQ